MTKEKYHGPKPDGPKPDYEMHSCGVDDGENLAMEHGKTWRVITEGR